MVVGVGYEVLCVFVVEVFFIVIVIGFDGVVSFGDVVKKVVVGLIKDLVVIGIEDWVFILRVD